jgi:hypothetical protein
MKNRPIHPVIVLFCLVVIMSLLMACLVTSRPAATPTPSNYSTQQKTVPAGQLPPGTTPKSAGTSQPGETGVPPTTTSGTAVAMDKADQDLQAGKYTGNFDLDLNCQDTPATSAGSKVQYTGIIKIQGTVDITVTNPKQAKASISYDADPHVLNAIYDITNNVGLVYTDHVTLSADPSVVMLAPLVDNYDPAAKVFANTVTFSEPQNEQYQIVHSGDTWNGRVEIDQKTTKAYQDALLKVVNEIDLHLQDISSQNEISGNVLAPKLRSDCTVTGKWQAAPLPD